MKQNLYEPGLPTDFMYGNGIPVGTWDDLDENNPYTEFQDIEDYPQYYQPPCQYLFKSKLIALDLFTPKLMTLA